MFAHAILFLSADFVLLSFIILDETSAEVGNSVEKMYCDILLSIGDELSDESREILHKMLAVEFLDKLIREEFDNVGKIGKKQGQEWGEKRIYEELEQKYGQIRAKVKQKMEENDQLDRYIGQMRTMHSQIKRAQNEDNLANQFKQSEKNQKRTESREEEKGRMDTFESDLARWHKQNLLKMLAYSMRPKKTLSELFDGQKAKWESELSFRLRQFVIFGEEQADKRLKMASQRVFELFGGRPNLFGPFIRIFFEFTSQIDVLDWLLRLYIQFLFADSQLAKRKAILAIDLLVFIQRINRLVHQKCGRTECDWPSFRMELARAFDHAQLIQTEHGIQSAELDTIGHLVLLHRLETELEQLPAELGKGWTVLDCLRMMTFKNDGETMDTMIGQMRLGLEKANAELLQSFVDTKRQFRMALQKLSGVELVRRLLALLGHSQMSKIGELARKSRSLETIPGWYLDPQRFQLDYCPNSELVPSAENYQDSDGRELANLYEQLLKDGELFRPIQTEGISSSGGSLFGRKTEGLERANLKIRRRAALWLMDNFVDEFLTQLDTFFEFGGDQKAKDQILNEMWKKWAETTAKTQQLDDEKQIFCHSFVFSMCLVNTIWMELGETERGKVTKIMAEMRWAEITIFGLKSHKSAVAAGAFATCGNSQHAISLYWHELLQSPNAELVHSLALFRLIKRFKRFSHFLCQMMQNDVADTKDRLMLTVHSMGEFDWLEKQFPMILRFECLGFRLRLHFFEQMLIFQSSTDGHRYSELRMALPILLKELDGRLFFGLKSGKMTHQTLEEAAFVVQKGIYPRGIGTSDGICRLMFLLKGIEERQNNVGKTDKLEISAKQLEECVISGAKLKQFDPFWETIRERHIEFLKGSKGNAFPLLIAASAVLKVPGAKARLDQIVGDKAYKTFWEKGLSAFAETEMFDKEVALFDHYLLVLLLAESENDRMTNKLAADLTVFVHWFDAVQKGAKMDKFWRKKRALDLGRVYDGLFEKVGSEFELAKRTLALEEMLKGMKGFLMADRKGETEKKLAEEWDRMTKRAEKEAHQRADGMPKAKKGHLEDTMPKWIKQLHAAKFKKYEDKWLMGREAEVLSLDRAQEWFFKELKKGLELSAEVVMKRLALLMEEQDMKELLEKLEIPFVKEIDHKNEKNGNDNEEGEEKKKKNKAKKIKRKKKQNKGEEEEEDKKEAMEGQSEADRERSAKTAEKEGEMGEKENSVHEKEANDEKEQQDEKGNEETVKRNGEDGEKGGGEKEKMMKEKAGKRSNAEKGDDEKERCEERGDGRAEEEEEEGENGREKTEGRKNNGHLSTGGPNPVAKCHHCVTDGKSQKESEKEKRGQRKGGPNSAKKEQNPAKLGDISKEWPNKTDEGKEKAEKSLEDQLLIEEIGNDAFLLEQYSKIVNGAHGLDCILLADLSVHTHEIEHQLEIYRNLANYDTEFRKLAMIGPAEEWQNKKREKVPKGRNERIELLAELCEMLRRMENLGEDLNGQNWEGTDEQRQIMCAKVKEQMHKRNLARQILSNDQLGREWAEATKEGQIGTMDALWGDKGGNRKARQNRRREFFGHLEQWHKMREQIKLDENLRKNYAEKGYLEEEEEDKLAPWNYAEYLQEIDFDEGQQNGAKTEEQMLNEILREFGMTDTNEKGDEEIQAEIGKIRRIVKDWSNGQGMLLVGGSFLLGVHTVGSDIDTVCVVPGHIPTERFFGTCNCTPRETTKCEDNSLLCALCEQMNVRSLQRIPIARVPLLKLTLSGGLKIDVLFASIPGLKSINIEEQNSGQIANLIEKLADQIKLQQNSNDQSDREKGRQMERMLWSLTGYHSNLKLLEMIRQNFGTFRKFVLALKLWAKNNYIYGTLLGFFGGVSLSILATKIILLYPGASVPFLLKRFFLTFSLWEWPLPVQTAEIASDSLSWSPEAELAQRAAQFGVGSYAKMTMPVIAPGYPEQNTAFNVNMITAKVIGKTMRDALNQLHFVQHKSHREKWGKVFGRRMFTQMYSHFFVVICVGSDNELNDEFCGFVATRIRPILLTSGQCAQSEANFCHATQLNECLGEIVQKYKIRSPKAICKAWVVGVNLKSILRGEGGGERHSIFGMEAMGRTDQNVQIDLGERILDSYKRTVLRKATTTNRNSERIRKFLTRNSGRDPRDFVHLESKFVDRAELAEDWRI